MTEDTATTQPNESRLDRRAVGWLIVAGVLTLMHWAILVFQIPVFTSLPGWFWPFTFKPMPAWWPILLLVAPAYFVLRAVWFHPVTSRYLPRVLLLVLLGTNLQIALSLLEGRQLAGLRDRIVHSGHAEFATVAVHQPSLFYVASHYEQLLEDNKLCEHAYTKPPGQLLLYMATAHIANIGHVADAPEVRLERLRTAATIAWPFLSYLVLIPLFYVARRFLDADRALLACILYLLIPSVNLITLHTDQVFFPAFSTGCIALTALAFYRRSVGWGLAAGALFYLSLFCTFGLLGLLPVLAGTGIGIVLTTKSDGAGFGSWLRPGLGVLAGVVVLDIVFRAVLDYDIVLRYHRALLNHIGGKGWNPSASTIPYAAVVNTAEFISWLGIPVAMLAGLHGLRSLRHIFTGRAELRHWLAVGLAATFLGLLMFGNTLGEVARLWLFLVPVVCILAADEILLRFGKGHRIVLLSILVLQGITVYLMKIYQDFW